MKSAYQQENQNQKVPRKFQHIFKADLIPLTPDLAHYL